MNAVSVSVSTVPDEGFAGVPVRGFETLMEDIWPLVFRIDPVALSRAMVALTPAFLATRPSVSSSASDPFA